MRRGLVAALVAAVCTATDVAVQTDTLELLEPKLGGVASRRYCCG